MTPAELDAVRARAEAATPGPWHDEHHIGDEGQDYGCVSIGNYGWVTSGPSAPEYDVDSPQGHADAEFIAHARTDVPALLALVAELTRERDEALQGYRDGQAAAGELVADLLRERDTAEAKGRRWAIEALRDHEAIDGWGFGEVDGVIPHRDDWQFGALAADYLESLAQPTTEETP